MLPSEVRTGADGMTIGNRMLSKSAWEELKPTIRNLYLDQTQTLKQLAEYIQEHHGFKPTYVWDLEIVLVIKLICLIGRNNSPTGYLNGISRRT